MQGRCTCGRIKYRMTTAPLFVHCCHCRWCQRETGTAFALNAMIESRPGRAARGRAGGGRHAVEQRQGQKISRCPTCRIAVWSNYAGAGDAVRFVRVGTLDEPDRLPPDIHIFTASKQPWVVLPRARRRSPSTTRPRAVLAAESLARREAHGGGARTPTLLPAGPACAHVRRFSSAGRLPRNPLTAQSAAAGSVAPCSLHLFHLDEAPCPARSTLKARRSELPCSR